ncbi:MAG: hypothetical protein ACXV7G_07555 [Halobacteriota archaeon]
MLSTIPIDLNEIGKGNKDQEILRAAIIGELDTINQLRTNGFSDEKQSYPS